MEAIGSSSVQSATQKLANSLGYSEVGKLIGVDPVLLMFWAFAGFVCIVHVILLWWMPPKWVIFLMEKGILVFLLEWAMKPFVAFVRLFYKPDPNAHSTGWWVRLVALVEENRTTNLVCWRILFVFYALWTMIMAGPYSLLQRLVSNPDTSRLIGVAIVGPIGIATVLWTLMNPRVNYISWISAHLPSGWIEPPGSSESIVWVTFLTVGILCGSLEFLQAFYPPIVKLFLGDVPISIYHAGIVMAAGFACVMTGIEVDGNHVGPANNEADEDMRRVEGYHKARAYHLGFLAVSLFAVVTTYLVLPAVDRKSFLSEDMRPMFATDRS